MAANVCKYKDFNPKPTPPTVVVFENILHYNIV